jgi:hypothetical protein
MKLRRFALVDRIGFEKRRDVWRVEGVMVPKLKLRICNPHQLNLKRNADVKATGANHGGCAMLAEIFMIRLEAVARAAKEAANSPRFVPVTLPAAKAS